LEDSDPGTDRHFYQSVSLKVFEIKSATTISISLTRIALSERWHQLVWLLNNWIWIHRSKFWQNQAKPSL